MIEFAKKWEKWHFSEFFILDFFQNHERYKKIVFTGMDWMHWGTFKPNIGSLNPETKKGPYILVNSCLFCTILSVFYLNLSPGQHLGNIWNLLFQKGTQADTFAFFSVFFWCISSFQEIWPWCIYVFDSPEHSWEDCGSRFLIWALKKICWYPKWPRKPKL